jgi:hypothetical protein
MDLDLSTVDVKQIITCTIEGILEPEDLAALASGALDTDAEVENITQGLAPVDDPSNLKKLRERHHSVARLIASGLTQSLVAQMTGYTQSYVSILLNNPAMQELVELYRVQYGSAAQIIGEKLRTVALQSVEEIVDRLNDPVQRKGIDIHGLTAVAKLGLDRSGHGPTSTTHHVNENHSIDHAQLAEINMRAREGSRERIVPVREVRAALTARPTTVKSEDAAS